MAVERLQPFCGKHWDAVYNLSAEDDLVHETHVHHVNHPAEVGAAILPPGLVGIDNPRLGATARG